MPSARPRAASASLAHDQLLMEGLVNASRAFRHRLWPELERERLTSPMFWALNQLVLEGPMNVGRIAGACVVTSASVSSAVDRLESAGLVVRSSSRRDRRFVTLTATRKGRALHRALWQRLAHDLVTSLDGVPGTDVEAAARVLGRLAQTTPGPPAILEAP
jgi:DNA-binding MarR family transcriptional regulator